MKPRIQTAGALLCAGLALAMVSGCGRQQPTEVAGGLPPLLDRQLFFDDPQIAGAKISPDGELISFIKPYQGVMNIWVKGRAEPFEAARPMTADQRPVFIYFWSQDGRYLLYAQDKGGNENFHVYAVDPRGGAEEASGVPPARNLTPIDGVRALIYAVPENSPDTIIVGLNDRDPALHDVYRLSLTTGERELLIRNDQEVGSWITDLDGNVRLAYRQTEDGGSEIVRLEGGRLTEPIYSCTYQESCFPVRFHKDGKRLYLESNHGEDVDLTRLVLLDLATGATEVVDSDPEGQVDFGNAVFSDASEELVATTYVGDRLRIYPKDETLSRDLEVLRSKLPDGELGFSSQTENDRLWLISVGRDVDPGSVYVYDRDRGEVELLYEYRPDLPKEHLAEMRPVRYQARDGRTIPAYLTLPKGVGEKNLPVVVFPHGGPWARDTWGYDGFSQFLANRGYAVLQPNFRGSTGYGKGFLNAGNNEWGTGAMQHDLTDGVRYLIGEGIADPERVAIMGGSYGGYATLAGMAFTPDLYACGVSIVGPSNLITLLKTIPPYWGPVVKKLFNARLGDPDDPEDRERLIAQSPLFAAEKIQAPLLVIQGANDPRVKQAESDQIVVAMRDLGREVRYLVAPDEGHGFRGRDNRLAMVVAFEQFLGQHLDGRMQEEVPPDIQQHLTDLWVDPATVQLSEPPQVTPRG